MNATMKTTPATKSPQIRLSKASPSTGGLHSITHH